MTGPGLKIKGNKSFETVRTDWETVIKSGAQSDRPASDVPGTWNLIRIQGKQIHLFVCLLIYLDGDNMNIIL